MTKATSTNALAKAKKAAQTKSPNVIVKLEASRKRKPVEVSDEEVEENDEEWPSKVLS